MTDSEKLRALATWFDINDAMKGNQLFDNEVQRDLRAMADRMEQLQQKEYEPYFGWCDVDGCMYEGANGGGCWRETGYWTVCSHHSTQWRAGKKQPKMKQTAIEREKRRGADGVLMVQN
jgi:hypothetical protein